MFTHNKSFTHLTQDERFRIEILLEEYYSYREIARVLQRNVSVISREVARNKVRTGKYCAHIAQKKTKKRRLLSKLEYRKIEKDKDLEILIEKNLRGDDSNNGDWSPEVLSNTILKGKISHVTIYAWIKRSRKDLQHLLPYQGRRRASYGSVPTRKYREMHLPSIDIRPKEVESRMKPGHFEGDTVVLKEGRLHTLVERKSRFLIADLITIKGPGLAMQISESSIKNLLPFPVKYRKTITYDQGSEFAWWDEMEKGLIGTKVYFAHAHSPWERGTNERTNGLIRRYFPKGKRAVNLNKEDVAKVVWRLNHRPRKILHWSTPCEVFEQCCTSGFN